MGLILIMLSFFFGIPVTICIKVTKIRPNILFLIKYINFDAIFKEETIKENFFFPLTFLIIIWIEFQNFFSRTEKFIFKFD